MIRRWLKFNAVGLVGIGVQLAALAALRSGLGLDYLLATALAVEITIVHNFFWHQRFTWLDRPTPSSAFSRFFRFSLTTGVTSIAGNLLLMRLFAGEMGIPDLPANLLAIACCSLANFLLSDRLVWGPVLRFPGAT